MAQAPLTSKNIGHWLNVNYGGTDKLNDHIRVLLIRVGQSIGHNTELNDIIKEILVEKGCCPTKLDSGLFSLEYEEGLARVVEKDLTEIREAIHTKLKNKIPLMFQRMCKYTDCSIPTQHPITTDQIGVILKPQVENEHLDFFYIACFKDDEKVELNILQVLQTLPGDWRQVKPQTEWPDTFFGYFPKVSPMEMEREREERLNREVRIPLKGILRKQGTGVHVILTRACVYT